MISTISSSLTRVRQQKKKKKRNEKGYAPYATRQNASCEVGLTFSCARTAAGASFCVRNAVVQKKPVSFVVASVVIAVRRTIFPAYTYSRNKFLCLTRLAKEIKPGPDKPH